MSNAGAEKPERKWKLLGTIQLTLDEIRLDGGTQSRADGVCSKIVQRYAENMSDGIEFDRLDVFRGVDDREPTGRVYHWLAHGFHRLYAKKQNRQVSDFVRVYEGSRRDAVLFSVGCNAEHGRQRTVKDIRHAVRMLLTDPEWWHKSINWIAQMCRVDWKTANRVKEAMVVERELAAGNDIDLSSLAPAEEDETVQGRSRHGGTRTMRKGRRNPKIKPVRIETEQSEIARIWAQVRRSDIKYVRQCLALDLPLAEIVGRVLRAYDAIPAIDADGNPRAKEERTFFVPGKEVSDAPQEAASAA